jgi:hypothetical protein
MSLINTAKELLGRTEKSEDEKEDPNLPEKSQLQKFLKWGGALAIMISGALLQATPLKGLSGRYSLPAEFAALIIGVLLLTFIYSEGRPVRLFSPLTTIILLIASTAIFLFFQDLAKSVTVQYEDGIVLKGTRMWPSAKRYMDTASPKPVLEADVLHHYNSELELVWPPESLAENEQKVTLWYLLGVATTGLTIIAAFDTFKSQSRKPRKKTTPKSV